MPPVSAPDFPGDPSTGIIADENPAGNQAESEFENFANDEPCPVLDPETGTCDLYKARPMTCRVFGPPVRSEGGLGVCELCYHGASAKQIAACELHLHAEQLETKLIHDVERATETRGSTIVAFALTR